MTVPEQAVEAARQKAIEIVNTAGDIYSNHHGDGAWLVMEKTYVGLITEALTAALPLVARAGMTEDRCS